MAFRSPTHTLDTVTFTLKLPLAKNDHTATLTALGSAETKRAGLWTWSEDWAKEELADGMDPTDTLRWWALIALQDHPRDQKRWNRLVAGWEGGEQLQLL